MLSHDKVIDFYVEDDSKKTVSGVTLAGTLAKPAQASVTSKSAFCRIAGGEFLCKVDPLPRGRHADLNISYSGKRAPKHASARLRVGPAHSVFELVFS